MRRVRWTPAQDNQLRDLVARGLAWHAVAETLRRTPEAVAHRARLLGVRLAGRTARPLPAGPESGADVGPDAGPDLGPGIGGWPLLDGSPEDRERRFLAALLAEARACGLLTPATAPSPQARSPEAA